LSLAGADRQQKRETTMKLHALATVALGIGLALAVPAVAQAYTSYTTGSVNFRSGPGVGYGSYGALPPGTEVEVYYCQPGWCRISSFLGTGWVSSSYLSGGRAYPRPYPYYDRDPYDDRVYPDPVPPPPPPYPYYYDYPRPGFGFYLGVP
jgi:uncharacterized protein YraI